MRSSTQGSFRGITGRLLATAGAALALGACNSSSFNGNSAKVASAETSGGATSGATGGATSGSTGGNGTDEANKGGSGNGTDQSNKGGIDPANSVASDGGTVDPCAGQDSQAGTSAAPDKSLLFYAPASYDVSSGGGLPGPGTEATSNVFLLTGDGQNQGVVPAMTAAGWNIKVVTSVQDSGISFDACSLHRAYKQIWLWLPCNNLQNMDDNSFAGITKYYDYGGGVVVLTDNHYYATGNPNTHCTPSDWGGTGGASDAVRLAQHMGFALAAGAGGGAAATPDNQHPLAVALANLPIDNQWLQNTITTIPAGAIWLPVNHLGNYAALLDQTVNPPGSTPPQLGLIMTAPYKYHSAPDQGDVPAFEAIASYFDAHVQASASIAGQSSLALADKRPSFDPSAFQATVTPAPTLQLRQMLLSADKDQIAVAVRRLAERGAITLDDLMAYQDDNRWLVRFSAAMAAGQLPLTTIVPPLTKQLQSAHLTTDMAIFCARALASAHATAAIPALQGALTTMAGTPAGHERDPQGELKAAIAELSALAAAH